MTYALAQLIWALIGLLTGIPIGFVLGKASNGGSS